MSGISAGPVAFARNTVRQAWSSRLAVPFRPASSGPVRYWQDRTRLAVKGALAAAAAWALAKYAAGQPDPYFAPLAALLGVYSTVARSLRESIQYIAGFVLGAALAIPVGMLLGPGTAGIAWLSWPAC
jgi:ABC-type nitrate/sulfonate/bicarbonate transport system permease component